MEEIYVIQLRCGKYYVGKTTDINRRYEEHKSGNGSSWTSKYKPIKIMEVRPIKDEHDENNTTKDLMKKYGVDNVRGGSYTQVELPYYLKSALETEIRGNTDACFKCGKQGHFARYCDEEEEDSDEELSSYPTTKCHEKSRGNQTGSCFRCGRKGHWANECYAKRHVNGDEFDTDNEYDDEDIEDDGDSDDY